MDMALSLRFSISTNVYEFTIEQHFMKPRAHSVHVAKCSTIHKYRIIWLTCTCIIIVNWILVLHDYTCSIIEQIFVQFCVAAVHDFVQEKRVLQNIENQ